MLTELNATVGNAKREVGMTTELINQIEAATRQLVLAQGQSEEYLSGINEVLVKVHEEFTRNMERSLSEGNRQFQQDLNTSVNMVSGAIKDLGETLDDLPRRK